MANALYTPFKQALLVSESHDLDADDVRAALIDSADYTFSAAHDFYDDVVAGQVALAALAGESGTGGTFDSNDFSWTSVSGDQSEAIVLVNYDGNGAATDAARQLIAFYDTSITGMPVTPNGGDINVTVNASGWFSL